jgi:hypothetical protein
MFAIFTLLCLAGLFIWLTAHRFRASRSEGEGKTPAGYAGWLGSSAGSVIKNTPRLFSSHIPALFHRLPCTIFEKLLAAGLALSFLYLALSGLTFALIPGHSIFGSFLVLHVVLGGLFALCLSLLVLIRARDFMPQPQRDTSPAAQDRAIWRLMFWIFAAASAVLTATALIPMLPILNHTGQLQAVLLHRYAALAAFVSFIVFIYFGLQSQGK